MSQKILAQLRPHMDRLKNLAWRRANRLTSLIPPPPYGGAAPASSLPAETSVQKRGRPGQRPWGMWAGWARQSDQAPERALRISFAGAWRAQMQHLWGAHSQLSAGVFAPPSPFFKNV